jgi:uncharacterized protein YciI
MPYLIDATDKPQSEELRVQVRPEHLAFLERNLPRLLAAGAKLRDEGDTGWGSVYILDTEDRAEAEAFIAEDPFSQAGLFGTVAITRWRKGFFDFKRPPPKA